MRKKYDLIIVNLGIPNYEDTIVQRVSVINGDYLPPIHLDMNNSIVGQLEELVEIIKRDKPDKIVFERVGMGHMFYDTFRFLVKHDKDMVIDSFGTIGFKEGV